MESCDMSILTLPDAMAERLVPYNKPQSVT